MRSTFESLCLLTKVTFQALVPALACHLTAFALATSQCIVSVIVVDEMNTRIVINAYGGVLTYATGMLVSGVFVGKLFERKAPAELRGDEAKIRLDQLRSAWASFPDASD